LHVARDSKQPPLILANPNFDLTRLQLAKAHVAKRNPAAGALLRSTTTGTELKDLSFAPLLDSEEEARAIKALLPRAQLLTGSQATKTALKRAQAPRILHIATHGFFLSDVQNTVPDTRGQSNSNSPPATVKLENPLLRSGLALAGANQWKGKSDNGLFTALEAAGLNLWGTKLVVLSACETGLGEVKNGEGVYGLRRALVLAGAETQMISLWKVRDDVTRELMTEYYRRILQGEGRGEALRAVQLEMLKKKGRERPYYWASFIQSGDWRNLNGK